MSSAPRCPRCNDRVYHAEEVIAIGNSYHMKCFSCKSCKKKLDSGNLCDKDNEIYCKNCYGRAFGPKGYGFGQGAGSLATFDASSIRSVPSGEVTSNAAVKSKWCNQCNVAAEGSFCGDCGGALVDRVEIVEQKYEDIHAEVKKFEQAARYAEEEARPVKASVPKQTLPAALKPKGKFGGGEKCTRCSKTVYDAEKTSGPNGVYHSSCFTCLSCNKTLSAITLCDREGEIYCQACYGKEFGPKGYGFGIGAGTLSNTGK